MGMFRTIYKLGITCPVSMCPANNNPFRCYSREKVASKKIKGMFSFLIYILAQFGRLEFVFSDGEQVYLDNKVGLFMTRDEVSLPSATVFGSI